MKKKKKHSPRGPDDVSDVILAVSVVVALPVVYFVDYNLYIK